MRWIGELKRYKDGIYEMTSMNLVVAKGHEEMVQVEDWSVAGSVNSRGSSNSGHYVREALRLRGS